MKEVINIDEWISSNKDKFLPPVSNKFLHKDGQLTVMFVGGPNSRCDFHVQEGEEFFYQMKGRVLLKVFVKGSHRDIVINEGEVFLLPVRVPHSPQRFKDTMGLVLERKRTPKEHDILRFFVTKDGALQPEILYETTFHWDRADTDMTKCLKEFSESEQFRSGLPKKGLKFESPFEVNWCEIESPKNLNAWISSNEAVINQKGRLQLFDSDIFKHKIFVYGAGTHRYMETKAQTWLFQLDGESSLHLKGQEKHLCKRDALLLEIETRCQILQSRGSYLLVCSQHP